ncbi:MAG: hypothetical protein MUF54_00555 [Polyangiaceae bacterium]|nr:hypothetical protein [Polyangiaceae bacterium]
MKRPIIVALWGLACAALIAGCGKKPGQKCSTEGEAECTGTDKVLTCSKQVWTEIPCRGPEGCETVGAQVNCDMTFGQVGEPCDDDGNAACTPEKKSALKCTGGKWQHDGDCAGGCKVSGTIVECSAQ